MKLLQFVEDDKGNLSSTRLGKLLITFGFIGDWVMHIIRDAKFEPTWTTMALVTAALGIGTLQRKLENGQGSPPPIK